MEPAQPEFPRRTVVKGAAWSLPVITATIAVPTTSASAAPCPPFSLTVAAADTGQSEQLITVPSSAKTITFRVQGGAGGGPQAGGAGAVIVGEIPTTGTEMDLLLVAGGRGHGRTDPQMRSFGYGSGNFAGNVSGRNGTGGGAGSAILRDGVPLVVAGGGGGAGGTTDNGFTQSFAGAGGSAGVTPTAGQGNSWAGGGRAASGGTAGVGGTGTAPTPGTGGVAASAYTSGQAGTAGGGRNGGGGGGAGAAGLGGGGGGGYAGGGGGASSGWTYADTRPRQGNSGGGGAGSSYIAPGVTGTVSTGPLPNAAQQPGSVTISWTC